MDEKQRRDLSLPPEISQEDVYEAMKGIEGYLDITPEDFRILYGLAYRHAVSRLANSVKAGDVMTLNVTSVFRDAPLTDVARVLATRGISGLPVLDGENRVAGVISEKDFVFQVGVGKPLRSFMEVVAYALGEEGCLAMPMGHKKAEDIMTSPPVTVTEEATLSEVASLMAEKNINRVPVTDREGKLVGIVARADIIQTSCTVIFPTKG
ncbi:MAG: CBS domain-containing protein [Desulfobacteraceae bacterium]|nr:MAG: CBS domain-containing protein [Desulfobacteraceae bacterium]